MAASSSSKIRVSASLKFPFLVIPKQYDKNFNGKVNGTAVVRVEAPAAIKSRISIDLVVVLDVSSRIALAGAQSTVEKMSMLAVLKKAMKFIIKHLDNGDWLTIVTFDKCTQISSKDRASAEKKVDKLVAVGHIGSKSGLKDAVKILNARSDMTRQGFIILVSDSSKSEEWSAEDSSDLLQKYPVHTFSLGKAQDPWELVSIAEKSNGTYSSIAEDLNSKIMEAFALCLAGLKSVFAVDTRVKISPKESPMITNSTITRIKCAGFRRDRDNNIVLGVLYAGEVKDFIVQIEFTVRETSGFSSVDLLTATVNYNDVQQKKPEPPVQCTLQVYVCATSFARDLTNEWTPFPMVLQQMARFELIKFMDNFRDELDALKNDDEVQLQYEAWRKLKSMWDESKKSNKFYSWKESQKIGVNLEHIENDIDAMVSCLKRGQGLGCVYSWVLSYRMQRATTTGLPTPAAFLTLAMKQMVQKAQIQSAQDAAATTSSAAGSTHLVPPGEEFTSKRVVEVLEKIAKILEDTGSKLDRGEPSLNLR